MTDYREPILEYIRASEAILEAEKLTDQEKEILQAMLTRLSDSLRLT